MLIGAGTIGLIVVLTVSSTYAVSDRMSAADAERKRLSSVVFKRGQVCVVEPYVPTEQVVLDRRLMLELSGRVGSLRAFLDKDVSKVRYVKFDYSVEEVSGERITVAQKSEGPVDLIYSFTETQWDVVSARLYATKQDKTYFDYTWRKIGNYWCPEQDKSELVELLTATLIVGDGVTRRSDDSDRSATENRFLVKGKVTASGSESRIYAGEVGFSPTLNANCPHNVGVFEHSVANPLPFQQSFRIGQKYYSHDGRRAICVNNSVYLSRVETESYDESSTGQQINRLSVDLTIRSIDDFSEQWSGTIEVDLEAAPTDEMQLLRIEKAGRVTQMSIGDRVRNTIDVDALIE